ncbi:MAG: pilus assembly PilX N-terminal domain-containing protein [Pseudomonadales bacterium]|nr:pilus assembly PilX N-terminal domain-containing protein [Pseudomonadales bacterium]MCP5215941.1 pilus assembly PilX N-terminal domain-containing protein [Pseudomonadales bacterium]
MCPSQAAQRPPMFRQAGFSLPIAVFILVIMALLAVGIAQLSSRSNLSATHEELSNRAFYAAESGASWAMSRLFFNASGPADSTHSNLECTAIGASSNLSFSQAGLYSCSAVVSCVSQSGSNASYYTINSQGSCGSGQVQAIRKLEIGAKNN